MASILRQIRRRFRKHVDMIKLRYRANFGRLEELHGCPPVVVIVQSFARPQNIELIVKIALRCQFVDQVIVSNNNPKIDLTRWVNVTDPRYTLISQERKMPCGTRYDIAKNLRYSYFICIDDDIFLRPDQISALYSSLLHDPSIPHGLFAEIWTKIDSPDGTAPVLKGGKLRFEGVVDVLNCVTAFSRQHLERYFEILESMGMSNALDIGAADDVVISSSGSGRPRCHDVGRLLICPTARDPEISLWQQEGFKSYRTDIFQTIRADTSSPERLMMPPDSPAPPTRPRVSVEPLITIAIPTYNRADTYLPVALQAALDQSWTNIEVIVGDNASADSTPELMANVADTRVRYIRHEQNIGANANFNRLLDEARGKWFLLLHDDDLIDSDFIESCLDARQAGREYGFIRTGVRAIDKEGRVFKTTPNTLLGPSRADFFRSWCRGQTAFYLCNTLYHTDRLRQIGGFHSLHNLLEDNYALVKLLKRWDHAEIENIRSSYRFTFDQRSYQVPVVEWCQDFRELLEMIVGICDPSEQASIRGDCARFFDHICVKHANGLKSRRRQFIARLQVARYHGIGSLRRSWHRPLCP